jgi:FkbM family methyltransferase
MSRVTGERYRARSLPERLAGVLPTAGPFGAIRRRLRPMFERLVAPAGGTLRCRLPAGEVVLIVPDCRHITWNPDEYAAFRAAVRPGDVILEAGANVGAYTILFALWAGPEGRVFAFEPDPSARDGLQRHVDINGMSDRVTVLPAAIFDDTKEHVRLAVCESSGLSRVAGGMEPDARVLEVPATSLDRFCRDRQLTPSVIKIDVEGAELAALRGARTTIARAGPRLALFVEMHPQLWPALGVTAQSIRDECATQRLRAEALDGSAGTNLWTVEGVCLRFRPGPA